MASICFNKATGTRRITFTNRAKERKTLYMGDADKRQVETVRLHVENILQALATKAILTPLTAQWLSTLDPAMLEKLASVGLVESPDAAKLGRLLDSHMAERKIDSKPNTVRIMQGVADALKAFYGEDCDLRAIDQKRADALRLAWIAKGWAENTIRRRLGIARQFFHEGIRRKLISDNPFEGFETTMKSDAKRVYFIPDAMALKILNACPNVQWKAIFALARWGGLRCPSEMQPLQWEHVNWSEKRILVTSPKTEHHDGKESRVIPLFPILEKVLLEALEDAPEGTTHVLWRYRLRNANLRTGMHKIIWEAGYKPWPKLFMNLRASRQTELAETFPQHVVCKWIGNSKAVADKFYLQVTDEHFERAVVNDAQTTRARKGATRRTTRRSAAPSSTDENNVIGKTSVNADAAARCNSVHGGAGKVDGGEIARDRNRTSKKLPAKDATPERRDAQNDARRKGH